MSTDQPDGGPKISTDATILGKGRGVADRTQATEPMAGVAERVTFHNPENGFCVLRVKARGQRDLVTVVGHAAMITAGEFVQISGAAP
jgi:exodeoxyribonuclease V alpha subunit